MSWLWVGSNLGHRARADLSSETLHPLSGVSWGTLAALCVRVEVQMEACPLSLCLASALFMGWLLQATIGGLFKGL